MRLGIDLGGSKIEVVALDDAGTTLLQRRIDTPRGDYDATVTAIRDLVLETERTLDQRGTVGIGMPGTLSPASRLVKNANSTWLNGRTLDVDLEQALDRPLRFANDANCFALSEAVDGAGREAAVVFGVILGTGVGGGLVVHGRVVEGRNAIGGEWGHNPMPWPRDDEHPGPPCYCGRSGCIETLLCGPAFERGYADSAGATCPAAVIVDAAREGNATARAHLDRYAERLARALAAVINIVDPDVIVLGGGLSRIDALYDRVPAYWPALVFSDDVTTELKPPRYGDSSGVRGAAWLWNDA